MGGWINLLIFTTHIEKRAKVMFSQVSVTHSVQGGGGRPGSRPQPPPPYALRYHAQVGGKHPTGMLSFWLNPDNLFHPQSCHSCV